MKIYIYIQVLGDFATLLPVLPVLCVMLLFVVPFMVISDVLDTGIGMNLG